MEFTFDDVASHSHFFDNKKRLFPFRFIASSAVDLHCRIGSDGRLYALSAIGRTIWIASELCLLLVSGDSLTRSVDKRFTHQIKTLGFGKPWRGGDMHSIGGGYKVNLLKEALEPFKDDATQVVLFTDR